MESKDYYCRLREMQNRLEKAKHHIKENVSRSRSRSKSPADMINNSQYFQQQEQIMTIPSYPSMTSQSHMIKQPQNQHQKISSNFL